MTINFFWKYNEMCHNNTTKYLVQTPNYIWQTPQPNPKIELSGRSKVTINVYSIAWVIYRDFAVNLRLCALISKGEN